MVGGILLGVFTQLYFLLYIVIPLFSIFMFGYVFVIVGFSIALSYKRNRGVANTKLQLQQFFDTENQRYYFSKGVQLKFSYDTLYVVGNKSTSVLFHPVLEIVMNSNYGGMQPQQQQPPQYYTSAPQAAPVYQQNDYQYNYQQPTMYQQQK